MRTMLRERCGGACSVDFLEHLFVVTRMVLVVLKESCEFFCGSCCAGLAFVAVMPFVRLPALVFCVSRR